MLKARFLNPVFTPRSQPPVEVSVERMSWAAMGGPKQAQLSARGNEAALWELAGLLRLPVEIRDERDEPVWWGYVDRVQVFSGRIAAEISLEEMANRIAVVYAHLPAGSSSPGERKTTAWADDLTSQSVYGIKEMLVPLDAASDEQALHRRDAELARRAYPVTGFTLMDQPASEPSATIHCRGWWDMFSWRRYTRPAGYVGNQAVSAGVQTVGAGGSTGQLAQGFAPSVYSWWAEEAWVRVRKVGNPADGLKIDVAADSGGAPGAELASVTVPASAISAEQYEWTGGALNTRIYLIAGTPYWLRLRRSGGFDANNYYQVDVDEGRSFAGGVMRIYNGSSWVTRAPDADLVFKVLGTEETTTQVAYAAIGREPQDFVVSVLRLTTSGIFSCPYQDGDKTKLQAFIELLESGTSAGERLLATMLKDRVLLIDAQVSPGSMDWSIDGNSLLYDERGCISPSYTSSIGHWVRLREGVIAGVPWGSIAHPVRSFIEEAEYDVKEDVMRLQFGG